MSRSEFGVALLGFGTVGSGIYRLLQGRSDDIARQHDVRFNICKILIRDFSRSRKIPLPAGIGTSNFEEVLADESVNVVIEVMGGETPARQYIERSLKAGKIVITANKELMGRRGNSLIASARRYSKYFGYCGAVTGFHQLCPTIINSIMIYRLAGIFNGTTNFILTKMKGGVPYSDALKEAQDLGYAESDPVNDIDGLDTKSKLVIASRLAFAVCPDIEKEIDSIPCTGIKGITAEDMKAAHGFGYAVKLLGIAYRKEGNFTVHVGPYLVPVHNILANVDGVENGIEIYDEFRGIQTMTAAGAGSEPTAMAIFSDLIRVARKENILWPGGSSIKSNKLRLSRDSAKKLFYIRLSVKDEPGILAEITKPLAKANINVKEFQQKEGKGNSACIVIMCGPAQEKDVRKALKATKSAGVLDGPYLILPVWDGEQPLGAVKIGEETVG